MDIRVSVTAIAWPTLDLRLGSDVVTLTVADAQRLILTLREALADVRQQIDEYPKCHQIAEV